MVRPSPPAVRAAGMRAGDTVFHLSTGYGMVGTPYKLSSVYP
jgi:hypothetical protein